MLPLLTLIINQFRQETINSRAGRFPSRVFFEELILLKKISFLTVLASVFFILSCAGFPAVFKKNTAPGDQQTNPSESTEQKQQSGEEQLKGSLYICGAQDGQMIIYGISSRLSKPNDEIEAAKLDAASKASMYHGIQGSVSLVNRMGANALDYSLDSVINLNYDTNFEQYIERLSFDPEKDVVRISGTTGTSGAVLVRMKYNASNLANVKYNSVKSNGAPTWVNNKDLPEIPGYAVAVGISGKKSQMKDAFISSMHAAAARLIEISSTQMNVTDKTASSTGSSTSVRTSSEGSLSNFHALEIWMADNGAVYTLAIARAAR